MPPKRRTTIGSSIDKVDGSTPQQQQQQQSLSRTTIKQKQRSNRSYGDGDGGTTNDDMNDNDIDNQSVTSSATGGSVGSRRSARLKRKRETSLTTTTNNNNNAAAANKVLNFDAVIEENEEELENESMIGMIMTTTTTTGKQQQQQSTPKKRMKLNPEHETNEENEMLSSLKNDTTTTTTNERMEMMMMMDDNHHHNNNDSTTTMNTEGIMNVDNNTNNDEMIKNKSIPSATVSVFTTNAVTTTMTTGSSSNTNHQSVTNVLYTEEQQPPPPQQQQYVNKTTTPNAIGGIIPIPYTVAATATNSSNSSSSNTTVRKVVVATDNAAVAILPPPHDYHHHHRSGEAQQQPVTTTTTAAVQYDTHNTADKREETVVATAVVVVDETVADVVVIKGDAASVVPVVVPLYMTMKFHCFILILIHIIYYQSTISQIMIHKDILRSFYGYTNMNTNKNINSSSSTTSATSSSVHNTDDPTDEWMTAQLATIQSLNTELHRLTLEGNKVEMELMQLKQSTNDLPIVVSLGTNESSSSNISSMDEHESIVQNHIQELTNRIKQLQSINYTDEQRLVQHTNVSPQQRNRVRNNIFLLDLSLSDFFDTIPTTITTTESLTQCNNENNASVQQQEQSSSSSLLYVQRDEMDTTVDEFKMKIREMIQTTLITNQTAKNHKQFVHDWILEELRNKNEMTRHQKQKQQEETVSSSRSDDTINRKDHNHIVRTMVTQRIRKVQSDLILGNSHDDDTDIVDYASTIYGGRILYSTPSLVQTLPIINRLLAKLRLRFYGHTAEMVITPKVRPKFRTNILGQCWSFLRRNPAIVMMELGETIHVQSISMEHPLASTRETAVRTFHVYGHEEITIETERLEFVQQFPSFVSSLLSSNDTTTTFNDGWYYLGTYVYDVSNYIFGTDGLVKYPITATGSTTTATTMNGNTNLNNDRNIPPLRMILLHIDPVTDPNVIQKEYNYTCLYRFRVHGQPSNTTSKQQPDVNSSI